MKLRANFALDIGLKSNNVPKLDVLPPKTKRCYVNDIYEIKKGLTLGLEQNLHPEMNDFAKNNWWLCTRQAFFLNYKF